MLKENRSFLVTYSWYTLRLWLFYYIQCKRSAFGENWHTNKGSIVISSISLCHSEPRLFMFGCGGYTLRLVWTVTVTVISSKRQALMRLQTTTHKTLARKKAMDNKGLFSKGVVYKRLLRPYNLWPRWRGILLLEYCLTSVWPCIRRLKCYHRRVLPITSVLSVSLIFGLWI